MRRLERRLGRAKLGDFKALADFDWSWPKKTERERFDALLSLDFIQEDNNVVLVGEHGLGKTTLAQSLAYNAVAAGHTVRFITMSELLLDLDAAELTRELERQPPLLGGARPRAPRIPCRSRRGSEQLAHLDPEHTRDRAQRLERRGGPR